MLGGRWEEGLHTLHFAPMYPWRLDSVFGSFEWVESSQGPLVSYAGGVEVPHWFLTLTFAVLPAIWLFKWNRRRKLGPNACPACGYDLTGNESGVCPECGVGLDPKR